MKKLHLNGEWTLKRIRADFSIENLDKELIKEESLRDRPMTGIELPCQAHDALLLNGVIENPNITGRNADTWIGESDWIYVKRFPMDGPLSGWTLHFDGLDTFAEIYLNGVKIGYSNDVYLPYTIENICFQAENTLVLRFCAPQRILDAMEKPEVYRGKVADISMARVFRSGFHDYCGPIPSLIRMGVYGDVWADRADELSLRRPSLDVSLDDTYGYGTVAVSGFVGGMGAESCEITALLLTGDGNVAAKHVQKGDGPFTLSIVNPLLWWPITHGTPNLYSLHLSLVQDGKMIDEDTYEIGFRRIEMRGDMAFYVNGKPVRLWGANLAHPDTVSGCYNEKRMVELIELSLNAHFNCLRVWGESEIYPDAFYELCDQKGILLWHDFYHAYSMYSEEPGFVELCKREAESLVSHLRHHPSILLWCGGNEMFLCRDYENPGGHMFGERIFTEIYPEVCARLDPARVYRVCSPWGGKFANDPTTGDTHGYTHLWFVPGGLYPVFASENCRVSAPPLRSMRRMMSGEELWPEGYSGKATKENPMEWPATWSLHNTNQGHIKLGPVERFYDATDAESMIYRLGAAHSLYIKQGVERYRRGRAEHEADSVRHTWGHLLWRLNNNSNIISFGVVDYFNEPLMAYYAMKEAYTPLLASFVIENEISVWLTNDTGETQSGVLEVCTFHIPSGKFTHSLAFPFRILEDESKKLGDLTSLGQIRRENVLVAYVRDEKGSLLSRNVDYLDIERRLMFPSDARLSIRKTEDGVLLSTDTFARSVELLGEGEGDNSAFGWFFSDNYFDLFPGEEKFVRIMGKHKKGTVTAKPYYGKHSASIDWNI